MLVTWPTFHFVTSPLKLLADRNIHPMIVTLPTLHVDMSPLKLIAEQNMRRREDSVEIVDVPVGAAARTVATVPPSKREK